MIKLILDWDATMFYGLRKIYIFNATGLQAFISVINEDNVEIKFLFDNETSLKGMAISARLLKVLGISKNKPIYFRKDKIVFYLNKVILIGILSNEYSADEDHKTRELLERMHDFISVINTDEVGVFIKNLMNFIRKNQVNIKG